MTLTFRVLGPVEARRDGQLLELGGAAQRALLAALLVDAGSVVGADTIGERVREGAEPLSPAALQTGISRLRRVLEPGAERKVLVTRAPGYRLAVSAADVDALHFAELLARARRSAAGGATQAARQDVADAQALWHGTAYADVPLRFAADEARRLAELRLGALELAAELDLQLGLHARLAGELPALVREHPLREGLVACLVLALYRSGRQAEGLQVLDRARRQLADELGVDPGPALQRLHEQVLRQDPALDLPLAAAGPAPRTSSAVRPLLDRDAELRALEQAVHDAGHGAGSLTLLRGPAGIGKTALLQHARVTAPPGTRVLTARASRLDCSFAYGVAGQVLEPVLLGADEAERDRLLSGAARRATAVLRPGAQVPEEDSYAVLHGLFWFVANLAEQQPLVLLVDDLQWADAPSLRFLEYLARRVDGLPVAVVATVRTDEPGPPPALLDELAAGPSARLLAPSPLRIGAVDEVLAATLGSDVTPAFAATVEQVTGGNPLLLTVLSREAAATGLRGRDDERDRVAELGARTVAGAVARRLRPLGPEALAVVRAVAVLGDRAALADVAGTAQVAPERVRPLLDALTDAGVLDGQRRFLHPLVQAAVLDECPSADRVLLHRRAAERLRERGAPVAEVALHRLAQDPAGDPETVADLRSAASAAAAAGAPETAVGHLRRALAEPPDAAQRLPVLLELGELELRTQQPEGASRMREVLALGATGDLAGRASAALGNLLVHVDPVAGLAELSRGLAEADDPGLRLQLEAFALEAVVFADALADEREARLAAGRRDPAPSPVLLAHLAVDAGCAGRPAAEVRRLAERALEDGRLLRHVGPASSTWNLVVHAFRFAEDPERCARALADGERAVRERGLYSARLFVEQAWAYWHRDFGSVAVGAARAQLGLRAIEQMGLVMTVPALTAAAAENLVHLDRLDEAAALVDQPLGPAAGTYIEPFALTARALVRAGRGQLTAAEDDLRRVLDLADARGWHSPHAVRVRLRLAEVLAASGRTREALELTDADLRAAEQADLSGARGMVLRMRSRSLSEAAALEALTAAVEALRPGPYVLELGLALQELAVAQREAGDRADAMVSARAAAEAAERTASTRLARLAEAELALLGGSVTRAPQRELSAVQRRVAELAGAGMSGKDIADELWLAPQTLDEALAVVSAA